MFHSMTSVLRVGTLAAALLAFAATPALAQHHGGGDRKSTRLNSSHLVISYAVFCLKKKKKSLGYAMSKGHDITLVPTLPVIVTSYSGSCHTMSFIGMSCTHCSATIGAAASRWRAS